MTTYYLDSSALVKRYLWEAGSHWINGLLDRSSQDSFASTELITIEVVCALARAERDNRISLNRRDKLANLFLGEVRALLNSVPVSAYILQNASRIALSHPLRAYDAIHLVTAQELARRLMWSGFSAPIFVSADTQLLQAARTEGLAVENPNDHE